MAGPAPFGSHAPRSPRQPFPSVAPSFRPEYSEEPGLTRPAARGVACVAGR